MITLLQVSAKWRIKEMTTLNLKRKGERERMKYRDKKRNRERNKERQTDRQTNRETKNRIPCLPSNEMTIFTTT